MLAQGRAFAAFAATVFFIPFISIVMNCGFLGKCGADASRAQTYDVGVDLYKDNNCMELIGDLELTIKNCYSNIYTNASAAYKVDIVRYHITRDETGHTVPQAINIHQGV